MSFSQQEIDEFKVEALELLDVAEKSLLSLDANGDFRSAYDAVFRCFHNLKGASGMMELHALQEHTHQLESILIKFKAASGIPKPHVDLFLRGVDAARSLLDGKTVAFSFEVAAAAPAPAPAAPVAPAAAPAPAAAASAPEAAAAPVNAPAAPAPATPDLPKSAIDEFISESEETVDRLSKSLQTLEAGKMSKDVIDGIYRDVHSLKGSASLFTYTQLAQVAHTMESSLEGVRSGTHLLSPDLLNGLFQSLKIWEEIFAKIKAGGKEEGFAQKILDLAVSLNDATQNLPLVGGSPAAEAHSPAEAHPAAPPSEAATSIRVSVALLDNLMTLMGEMVLVRNQVLQFAGKSDDLGLLSMSKRLNAVTSEIQGEMMKTRMQPIGNVLGKFTRVVRDLSQELQKNITLNISGSETELDKSLLEAIKDPLTHIVRNSCDHGIESPEARKAAGKSPGGTITIKSYHEGGQVVIDVADDGKGLHKSVLLKKAIEKGIITQAQSEKMSEKEIFNLIFAPGFSTAAKVSNVSGRGVGMDVVLTNIERIGGTVDLASVEGSGTTIKIKIPLTLAIIPALMVKCCQGHFAIPQVKLEELVRVDQSSEDNKVEVLHGVPVYRLRGKILPLVDLNQVLCHQRKADDFRWQERTGALNIAVVSSDAASFGLIIDEVHDTADIVVKPLSRLLKSLQVYSGATILGDGSLALILDIAGISRVARIGLEPQFQAAPSASAGAESTAKRRETQDYLLVRLNSPTKHALVLNYLHRLEEFKKSQVEMTGAQRVVRYGKTILPLVDTNKRLGYGQMKSESDRITVLVTERQGKLYGLEVDEILDTFSSDVEMEPGLVKQPGIFGNLNTPAELIVVMDPFEIIAGDFPAPVSEGIAPPKPAVESGIAKIVAFSPKDTKRVLLVEDTVFFRKAMRTVLEKSGYEVVQAADGKEALELLNSAQKPFDIIVSDIEMPRVNGFELATQVRANPNFAKIPMLAISSRADTEHMREGARVGFDCYLEKLKPAVLLSSVAELIGKTREAA